MLLDTRTQNNQPEAFNPQVQNQVLEAKASIGAKVGFALLCIITIGLFAIYLVTKRNDFNRKQMKINEAASGIEIQLAQRKDTLVKLIDATKSSMKYEQDLLTSVTALRSTSINKDNVVDVSNKIEQSFGRLVATFERYPDLKSTSAIQELMSSADYQEREIAATRRLYNSLATSFNEEIFTWPACVPATQLKLHTFALFAASEAQKQDVSLKLN